MRHNFDQYNEKTTMEFLNGPAFGKQAFIIIKRQQRADALDFDIEFMDQVNQTAEDTVRYLNGNPQIPELSWDVLGTYFNNSDFVFPKEVLESMLSN